MIILDLEATCDNQPSWNRDDMEIIQIGAVLVGTDGFVVEAFNRFAKPSIRPELTKFCTQLTGITQAQVDNAQPLRAVLAEFNDWMNKLERFHKCKWGSWGAYDRNQFIKDANRQKIKLDFLTDKYTHYNLKNVWSQYAGKRPMGLGKAVTAEGRVFQGRAHNALVDAENIARLTYIKRFLQDLSK